MILQEEQAYREAESIRIGKQLVELERKILRAGETHQKELLTEEYDQLARELGAVLFFVEIPYQKVYELFPIQIYELRPPLEIFTEIPKTHTISKVIETDRGGVRIVSFYCKDCRRIVDRAVKPFTVSRCKIPWAEAKRLHLFKEEFN